mgnify:FL=1
MPKIQFRDAPKCEVRLLPYWVAVKQFREGKNDGLSKPYFWLYVESNPNKLNGVAASDIHDALPFHIKFKMERNFFGSESASIMENL